MFFLCTTHINISNTSATVYCYLVSRYTNTITKLRCFMSNHNTPPTNNIIRYVLPTLFRKNNSGFKITAYHRVLLLMGCKINFNITYLLLFYVTWINFAKSKILKPIPTMCSAASFTCITTPSSLHCIALSSFFLNNLYCSYMEHYFITFYFT